MIESNKHSSNQHEYRQPSSEEILEDINTVPKTDNHWLRVLARLNGNWLQ
jgi:hypothetical protein